MSLLARVGLVAAEPRLAPALAGSAVVRGAKAAAIGLHNALAGLIRGSALARVSDKLAVGAVCLLFLASPFVGTGINAALALLALGLVLFRLVAKPGSGARFSAIDLPVLAFVAVHLVATGFSPFFAASLKGLAKMGVYWAAYFAFRQTLTTPGARKAVLTALLAAGALEAAYGVSQWFTGVEPLANWEDPETLNPLTRVYGSLLNPNLLAGYLLPLFPLGVAAGLVWKGPHRLVGLAAAVAAPVCVWFTYSRGAYLGLAASLAVFGALGLSLLWPRVRASRALQGGLVAGALALVTAVAWRVATNPGLSERIGSIFTLRGHSSNSFRVNVWTGVLAMLQDNWLIGVGIGNAAFRHMYGLYMVSGFEALGAYNVFLEVASEMGVLGLLVFVWLLLATCARCGYTFRVGAYQDRWFAAAILAGLAGTFVMGMVDTVFYRPAVQLQFWLLLALAVAISPRKALEVPHEDHSDR